MEKRVRKISRGVLGFFFVLVTLTASGLVQQQQKSIEISAQRQGRGNADRGKYIVEHVAMCIQCHSPRDERGRIVMSELLMGAPIPFTSPFQNQQWANTAPRIAGLPQYTEEGGIRLLTTGISRTGKPPMPPMPPFRMAEQDARDVVAFLKSLR